MRSSLKISSWLVVAMLVGCGGRDSGVPSDGGTDASDADGLAAPDGDEAGWTQCSSPSGYAVCYGPSDCSNSQANGGCQSCSNIPSTAVVGCVNSALIAYGEASDPCSHPCSDGSICVAWYGASDSASDASFFCAPYDLGVLFAQNGGADRVRYLDMGLWTGDPLPEPRTCPTVPGVSICGGNCGLCPQGETCTGRSPLHPYGFCAVGGGGACPAAGAPTNVVPYGGCGSGQGCLNFTVEPTAQALANEWGICLPSDLCNAVAAGLPGGATCSIP
jgi:hypothetical protein